MRKNALFYSTVIGLLFQFFAFSDLSVFASDPCEDFTSWLTAHPSASAAGNGILPYREDLIRSGMDAKEAD